MLIVCCGMIRSGSTLQYNLARNMVELTGSGMGEGFVEDPRRDARLRPWAFDRQWHVIKAHTLADWMLEEQMRSSTRFFYCHRNLHDVVASARRKFDMSRFDIWKRIDVAVLLHQHLKGIAEAEIYRYEALIDDVSDVVRKMAAFLGLALNAADTALITARCSLANAMQIQAAVHDLALAKGGVLTGEGQEPTYDEHTLLHQDHISPSQGKDNAWHQDLTANDLMTIDRRYGSWLRSEGYRTA